MIGLELNKSANKKINIYIALYCLNAFTLSGEKKINKHRIDLLLTSVCQDHADL